MPANLLTQGHGCRKPKGLSFSVLPSWRKLEGVRTAGVQTPKYGIRGNAPIRPCTSPSWSITRARQMSHVEKDVPPTFLARWNTEGFISWVRKTLKRKVTAGKSTGRQWLTSGDFRKFMFLHLQISSKRKETSRVLEVRMGRGDHVECPSQGMNLFRELSAPNPVPGWTDPFSLNRPPHSLLFSYCFDLWILG